MMGRYRRCWVSISQTSFPCVLSPNDPNDPARLRTGRVRIHSVASLRLGALIYNSHDALSQIVFYGATPAVIRHLLAVKAETFPP